MKPVYLLMFVTLITHMSLFGARMDVALYALHLGASPATVGLLTALFGLLPVLLSIYIGRWADRVGTRKPMLTGGTLLVVGMVTAFAFGNLVGLYLVALIAGLGYNFYFIAQQHLAGRIGRPEELATNLSLTSMSFSLSGFISPIVTGLSIDHVGARPTFLILASLAVAGMILVATNRAVFGSKDPAAEHGRGAAPAQPGKARGSAWDLMRQPELRRIYIVAVLSQSTWDTFGVLMPIYGTEHGFSASVIGMVLGVFSVATLVIRLLLPILSRHLKPWQMLLVSMGGSSITYFGIPLVDSMLALLVLSIWLGFVLGLAAPMLLVLIHQVSPPARVGEAVGLRVTLMNASQTAIPLSAGGIVSLLGLTSMFWMLALTFASGAWFNRARWHPDTPGDADQGSDSRR
jgi:predicted MFS family arabinose efflux permease